MRSEINMFHNFHFDESLYQFNQTDVRLTDL